MHILRAKLSFRIRLLRMGDLLIVTETELFRQQCDSVMPLQFTVVKSLRSKVFLQLHMIFYSETVMISSCSCQSIIKNIIFVKLCSSMHAVLFFESDDG